MKKLFPEADAVVFGHSHIPFNSLEEGILLFNPGSATDKRLQPNHTMGTLSVANGYISGTLDRIGLTGDKVDLGGHYVEVLLGV